MSLESELNVLNANLSELTLVLKKFSPAVVDAVLPGLVEVSAGAVAKAAEQIAETVVKPKAEKKAEKKAEPKPEPEVQVVTREQVATQLISVVKSKGRQIAVDVLGTFGAKTVGEVPEATLSSLLDALVAAGA